MSIYVLFNSNVLFQKNRKNIEKTSNRMFQALHFLLESIIILGNRFVQEKKMLAIIYKFRHYMVIYKHT